MDVVHSGWVHSGWAALSVALLWCIAACLWPLAAERHRPVLLLALVAAGVPVLGWLTYCCGPAAGFVGFGLGVGLLTLRPLRRRPPQGPAALSGLTPVPVHTPGQPGGGASQP